MKVPTKYQVKKKSGFSRFFSNISSNIARKLASRYVEDCHPSFMQYIEVRNVATASMGKDITAKRYKKIMKILSSKKYRDFFFRAVKYNPANREATVEKPKWYVAVFDRIVYRLSQFYVYLFQRALYNKIKYFEKVSAEVADLSARVDRYIASTTFEQRLSRMQIIGLISNETFREDVDVLLNRIPSDVIEARRREKEELLSKDIRDKMLKNIEKSTKDGVINGVPEDIIRIIRNQQK